MGRLIETLSVALFVASAGAFARGVAELSDERDFQAVYWIVLGAILLKGSIDLLRPLRSS